MANNDWDLDELLNFDFEQGTPDGKDHLKEEKVQGSKPKPQKPASGRGLGDTFDAYEEYRRYEQLRHTGDSDGDAVRKAAGAAGRHNSGRDVPVKERRAPAADQDVKVRRKKAPAVEEDKTHHSAREIEALKKASKDAYDRYRSNYVKGKKKREGAVQVGKLQRILTRVYIAAFGVFAISMTAMNVLPFGMAALLYGVIILVSAFIYFQTRKEGFNDWGKRVATGLAALMLIFFGVGTAYSLGTLSFLSGSSVKSENAVSDITRKPFNFTITGIDVDGTIDEKGRSDVNMVVTVNPSTHQILMTSIPRDYEIYMTEYDNAVDKLTHTGAYGVATTIGAEEQLLDTKVNYYVKVNFTTVERFIDAVGGVDVESDYEFTPVKLKTWTVHEGVNHMDGEQALAFARERKAFPDGDRQRIRNQQAVFEALIRKATSSRTMMLNYNNVLSSLTNYFEMSFSSQEIRKLVKYQLAKNPDWQIYRNSITGDDGMLPLYTTGGEYAYVMTQNTESIENAKTLINAVLEGQALQRSKDGTVTLAE